mgnify:FL=1
MPDPITPTTAGAPAAPAPLAQPAVPARPSAAPARPAPARSGAPRAAQADDLANDRTLSPSARAKWAKYRDEMHGKLTASEQRAQQFEQQFNSTKADYDRAVAEQDLKVELARAGIRDMEYGWFQYKKHLKALSEDNSPEGVQKFKSHADGGTASARAWAEEQRATSPYIFGEQPVPATTGAHGIAPPPAVPGAAGVTAAAARAGQVDATKLSKSDFEARMQAVGINHRDAREPRR